MYKTFGTEKLML